MQTIIKKLKLIYLPFIVMTVIFVVAYTFINWFFFVRTNNYPVRKDLLNFWYPMALSWIPILIWLRPRIKLLKLRGANGHLHFIYLFTAALAIGIPTVNAQTYMRKAAGKMTNLETINQINNSKPTKYYTLKNYYIDTTNVEMHSSVYLNKNKKSLNMQIFYVLPIFERAADTAKPNCLAWMGVKYYDRISNGFKPHQKKRKYYEFASKSQKEFDKKNFLAFQYLKRVESAEEILEFKKTIDKSPKASSTKTPVFLAVNQPFEDRTEDTLAWFIGACVVSSGIWLIMVTTPKFADSSYPDAESYILEYPESIVLEAIKSFKIANPQHLQPQYLNLNDGHDMKDHAGQLYHLYFFYPENYQIVYAWTRPIDNNSTELALVAINDGLMLGNWKDINKDFTVNENNFQKEKFTNTIFNKIKMELGSISGYTMLP